MGKQSKAFDKSVKTTSKDFPSAAGDFHYSGILKRKYCLLLLFLKPLWLLGKKLSV